MHPDVVADVGNTRIKWGWGPPGEPPQLASLPPDDPFAWADQLALLPGSGPRTWAMAGVHPGRLALLCEWAEGRGDRVHVIGHARVPMRVEVTEPTRVGIDRLLNALAAVKLVPRNTAVLVLDVGTAVTADVVDGTGVFVGGAIYPGPRLMFEALHRYTAKLPLLPFGDVPQADSYIGQDTAGAMAAGVAAAQVGALREVMRHAAGLFGEETWAVLTGGGLGTLADLPFGVWGDLAEVLVAPTLTLDGIRLAAGALK
jgi:type III pantothenate kinase